MIERLRSFQAARRLSLPVLRGVAGLLPLPAFAADEAAGAGNIAWVLSASALVLFMTLPGLALFYGGLVRARNLLSVLMHCFVRVLRRVAVVGGGRLQPRASRPAGRCSAASSKAFSRAGCVPALPDDGLPEAPFVLFQMTFAIITPALIIGAFPERVSFPFLLLFYRRLAADRRMCRWRIGCGARAGSRRRARSILPAASSCTRRPACRRWSSRC